MKPFADHAVLITGASEGIGAEVARQLASQGAWLALAARRTHELDVVAQECIARGGRAIVVPADVTDPAQCEQLVVRTLAAYGKLDVLVANAGVGAHFAVESVTDLSVFDRVMRVNYLGTVYCVTAALPALRRSAGRVVAVSSVAGKVGLPNRAAYSASKHAMQGFLDSLRIELSATGVSVTTICPGYVRTGIRRAALDANGAALGATHSPDEKVMSAEECARQMIVAMEHRERELVMLPRWRMLAILRVLFPGWIDRMAARTSSGNS